MPEVRFTCAGPTTASASAIRPRPSCTSTCAPANAMTCADFMARSRTALTLASERVRLKYGYACSSAMDQLARLEAGASRFETDAGATVTVETLHS